MRKLVAVTGFAILGSLGMLLYRSIEANSIFDIRCNVGRNENPSGTRTYLTRKHGITTRYIDTKRNGYGTLDSVVRSFEVYDIFFHDGVFDARNSSKRMRDLYAKGSRAIVPTFVHEFDDAVERFETCGQ